MVRERGREEAAYLVLELLEVTTEVSFGEVVTRDLASQEAATEWPILRAVTSEIASSKVS